MKSSMVWAVVIGLVLVAVTVGLVVYSTMQSYSVLCEVCITYQGRTSCREAYGKTQEEATRTATDNACGLLASGMTDSIRCSNKPPDSVTCQ